MLKKLLTSVLDVVNITELLGKHQEKQLDQPRKRKNPKAEYPEPKA